MCVWSSMVWWKRDGGTKWRQLWFKFKNTIGPIGCIMNTSQVLVEGKSSVCLICMKYRIIILIIIIISLGQILLSYIANTSRTHARTHARSHARTNARMHACTHARTHACTHACTPERTHAHAPARTNAHTHTHTHTYRRRRIAIRWVCVSQPWRHDPLAIEINTGTGGPVLSVFRI